MRELSVEDFASHLRQRHWREHSATVVILVGAFAVGIVFVARALGWFAAVGIAALVVGALAVAKRASSRAEGGSRVPPTPPGKWEISVESGVVSIRVDDVFVRLPRATIGRSTEEATADWDHPRHYEGSALFLELESGMTIVVPGSADGFNLAVRELGAPVVER